MADNSVALQVQTPNSFQTIGNMMNLAQGAQALKSAKQQYQAGTQSLQREGIALQQEQQKNAEFKALSENAKQWIMPDGSINLEAANKIVPTLAPHTGPQYLEKLTTLQTAKTNADQAKLNFTGAERSIVAGLYGVLGRAGVDDPKIVMSEMDQLKNLYKDNPHLSQYIDSAKVGLQNMPAGQGALNKTLVSQSQALLSPESQQSQLSPQAGLTSTGGNLMETVTQPAVGGNQPSVSLTGRSQPMTLGPESRESPITDQLGNISVATKNPQGQITATRAMPGSGAPGGGQPTIARFGPGELDNIKQAQGEVVRIRQAGDQVPLSRNINQQILKLSRDTKTGPGTSNWQSALGAVLAPFGVTASNYQELGKYLEKNALQNMQEMGGPPSDARLQAAAAANGSTTFNPEALQSVTKFNDATTSALDKYRQGVDKAIGLANPDYSKLPAFKAEWAKNMDVDIFRVENAVRDGDTKELEKIKGELGPQRLKALAVKRKRLEELSGKN